MQWTVFAETTGLVTFPPDHISLSFGTCQVSLKDPSQAATHDYKSPLSAIGLTITHVEKTAPIRLLFQTTVEAEREADARSLGFAEIELAADLLSLASGGTVAPVHVTNVRRNQVVKSKVRFYNEASVVFGDVVVWKPEHDELVNHIGTGLNQLADSDYQRVRNAFRWLRRAGMEDEPCVQFLFLWFAVEALSGMSFVQVSEKRLECRKCQKPLVCACGQNQAYIPDVRGRHLLVDTLRLWGKKEYTKRYQLRSKVAHGTISVRPGKEENEILEAIPHLRDAVITTVERLFNGDLDLAPKANA